jgi:hypothetical protein
MFNSIRVAAIALAIVVLVANPVEARHRARYRRCCTSGSVTPVQADCSQPCGASVLTKPNVKLELATVGSQTRDRIVVRITATNLGTVPIVWDNEFAALMDWSMRFDADEKDYRTTGGETVTKPANPLAPGRFIRLQPGEAVAKDVDLTKGVRIFETGHGTVSSPEGYSGHIPTAFEAVRRFWIPEKSGAISVLARYSDSDYDNLGGDTFQLYFGKTVKDAGLPKGRFESNRLVIQIAGP